jgi:uncharacterized membrane protein
MSQKNQEKSAAKKAAVLGTDNKKNRAVLPLVALCAALAVGGGILLLWQGRRQAALTATVAAGPARGGEVSYATNQFEDRKAQFFEYTAEGGLKIRYFVLKSSDGIIRSAFDACDSCWRAGKGYYQEGDEMVCRNCRQRFPSVKVMEVKGGCNPVPLPNQARGAEVVIRLADILAGRPFFDLKKGG